MSAPTSDTHAKPVPIRIFTPRAEHLAWCKERALRELDAYPDDQRAIANAVTSMCSDLFKHPGTAGHIGIRLLAELLVCGLIPTLDEARRQIEGFD